MPALAIRKGSLVRRTGRTAHIFDFPFLRKAEKPGVNTMPCRGIQPLSQNLRFCQLPLHRGAESRRWRIQRERQAAAVRKCESEQPKHERLTAKEPRNAPQTLGANLATGAAGNAPQAGLFPACPRRKIGILIRKNYYFWRNYI